MCRWFAYIAPEEECLLEDVLIIPAHALSKQVHEHYLPKLISHTPGQETSKSEISLRNRLQNVDGFGLAWYTPVRATFNEAVGPRPTLYKHPQPPTNDANFHSICANTASTTVLAHIRAATASAVVPVNNHPFVFGRHAIMHNGVITDFADIKRQMLQETEESVYKVISGLTDSEHLAALYMTYLTMKSPGPQGWEQQYPLSEMKEALQKAIVRVIQLQQELKGKDKAEANSLNVCCSDGERLIAFRYRNHGVEQPPSLYWSTKAGVTMNRKYPDHADGLQNEKAYKSADEHGVHMIVASEPSTYKVEDWSLIKKNHALLVDKNGQYHIEAVDTPHDLLATAKTTQHA